MLKKLRDCWKNACHLTKSNGAISMFTFDLNKIGKILKWKWNSKSKTEFEKKVDSGVAFFSLQSVIGIWTLHASNEDKRVQDTRKSLYDVFCSLLV